MTDPVAVGAGDAGARSASSVLVPEWLVNVAALGWRLLAIAGVVVVGWFLVSAMWTTAATILLSTLVAAAFSPMLLRMRAAGRSRNAAAVRTWGAVMLGVIVVLAVLALWLVPDLVSLGRSVAAGVAAVKAQAAALSIPPWVPQLLQQVVDLAGGALGELVAGIVTNVAQAVTVGILSIFLLFFLLLDGDKAWTWLFQPTDDEKRARITAAGAEALDRIGGYLRGTSLLAFLIGVTDLVFLWILGVPFAVPLALLALLAAYIPYFGGILATLAIVLVAYAANGFTTVVLLLVLLAIRNVILGLRVRSWVYSTTVSVHPALVLVSLPAGFALAGVIGVFAAVPVTATFLIAGRAAIGLVEPWSHQPLPPLVPAWIDRLAQISWRALVVGAVVGMIVGLAILMPLVVVPVVIALVFAATMQPSVAWLERKGLKPGQSAALMVIGGGVVLVIILTLVLGPLVQEATQTAAATQAGAASASNSLQQQLQLLESAVEGGSGVALQLIGQVAEAGVGLFLLVAFSGLLTFTFLKDGRALWQRTIGGTRPEAAEPLTEAGGKAFQLLGGYMIGTGAISFVGAASQAVIMFVLGLPYVMPVFVLSFILCFIPYIGGFVSTGIAFLIAFAYGSPAGIIVMLIWTVVFNIVQGNVVSPIVYSKTVHLHPAIVLLSIPAAASVAGIMGMFLVVPVLGVVAGTWRIVLSIVGRTQDADAAAAAAAAQGAAGPPPTTPGALPAMMDAT
ncbi:MAG: AI-2E family transporter [Chloroflexota bacterium]